MANLLLLNGPNLNLLGTREPDKYGTDTLESITSHLTSLAEKEQHHLEHFQSNIEGEIIDRIHQAAKENIEFILINPAAFTHTSIAIRDAILGTQIPFIEIHLSNVHQREEFRHYSYFSDIAVGTIVGLGSQGYELGLQAALKYLQNT